MGTAELQITVWWLDLDWMPGAHQAPLSLPSSAGKGGGKIRWKGSGGKIRTGRDHLPVTVTGITDSTWGKLV